MSSSFLSLNEIKTGTFLQHQRKGDLLFQKAFKQKAGSETRNQRGAKTEARASDIFKG